MNPDEPEPTAVPYVIDAEQRTARPINDIPLDPYALNHWGAEGYDPWNSDLDWHPPFLTHEQAGDAIEARYGGEWAWDDPEWWRDMVDLIRRHGIVWLDA